MNTPANSSAKFAADVDADGKINGVPQEYFPFFSGLRDAFGEAPQSLWLGLGDEQVNGAKGKLSVDVGSANNGYRGPDDSRRSAGVEVRARVVFDNKSSIVEEDSTKQVFNEMQTEYHFQCGNGVGRIVNVYWLLYGKIVSWNLGLDKNLSPVRLSFGSDVQDENQAHEVMKFVCHRWYPIYDGNFR